MLPADLLPLITPLHRLHEAQIDDQLRELGVEPCEQARKQALLGDVDVEAAIQHGERKREVERSLAQQSDELIRKCVLEASHWGYLVVKRSPLAKLFHSDHAGRILALHALSRLSLHVSGSETAPLVDDEQMSRLAADLLQVRDGCLLPLPKGRTAGGMVVRPGSGRFARRLCKDEELMILTREPDHESGTIGHRRLGGNWATLPLQIDGDGVYWDNRFVIMATSAEKVLDGWRVRGEDVWKASLKQVDGKREDVERGIYVRQIRRQDWEVMTASNGRVKDLLVPFQCIRALPAICDGDGVVASPHVGLSSKSGVCFVAVRVPRFHCLPKDVDPGFVGEDADEMQLVG